MVFPYQHPAKHAPAACRGQAIQLLKPILKVLGITIYQPLPPTVTKLVFSRCDE